MSFVSLAAKTALVAQTLTMASTDQKLSLKLAESVSASTLPNDFMRNPSSYLLSQPSFYLQPAIQNLGLINWSPLGFLIYEGTRASVKAANLMVADALVLPLAEAKWQIQKSLEQLTAAESVIDAGGANCLARMQNRDLSRKDFHCFLPQDQNAYCEALAVRGLQPRLETWQTDTSRCYLHTTARDERNPWSGLHGNVTCLDQKANRINRTLASDIGFVSPTKTDHHFISFDFASPKLTRVDSESFKEIADLQSIALSDARQKNRMPRGPVGIYGCVQDKNVQFFMVPGDVYLGRRLPETEQTVWQWDGRTLATTSRSAAESKFSRFDQVSPLRCARDPAIDAVCGFSIVAAAAQIAFENETIVTRMVLAEKVRLEVFDKLIVSLERVDRELNDWPLQSETQRLIGYFSKLRDRPFSSSIGVRADTEMRSEMIEHLNLPTEVYSKIFP